MILTFGDSCRYFEWCLLEIERNVSKFNYKLIMNWQFRGGPWYGCIEDPFIIFVAELVCPIHIFLRRACRNCSSTWKEKKEIFFSLEWSWTPESGRKKCTQYQTHRTTMARNGVENISTTIIFMLPRIRGYLPQYFSRVSQIRLGNNKIRVNKWCCRPNELKGNNELCKYDWYE